jgi:hypothetical protein
MAAGAGLDISEARRPAIVPVPGGGGRLLVFAAAHRSSGTPEVWKAGDPDLQKDQGASTPLEGLFMVVCGLAIVIF